MCNNEDLNLFKSDDFYQSDHDSDQLEDDEDQHIFETIFDQENMTCFQSHSYKEQAMNDRLPNTTELSVMLVFLWRRHSLSKTAIDDICRILNTFNISNMPKDFRTVVSKVKKI